MSVRVRSVTHARKQTNSLCQQVPDRYKEDECQNREEREPLDLLFTCQSFNTYILGRSFIVECDHKSLTIKDLMNVLPYLWRMVLQLKQYDLTIKYKPGHEMLLADTLSQCPVRTLLEINLDVWVDYIAVNKDWIEKLRDTTSNDQFLE